MYTKWIRPAAIAGLAAIGFGSPASAAPTTVPLDSTVGQDFEAQYTNTAGKPWNSVVWTKNATNVKQSTLALEVTFETNAPIDLTFVQTGDFKSNAGGSAGGGASDGLNFLANETIHNKTGNPWMFFREDLIEMSNLDTNLGSGGHPQYAHFHYPGTTYDPMVATTTSLPLLIMGGSVANGNDLKVTNLRIHEIMSDTKARKFILRLTPIPEPGAFTLLALGLVGIGTARWWRRFPTRPGSPAPQ